MADDREEWWEESLEALPIAVPIGDLPPVESITLSSGRLTVTYDPTPAGDPFPSIAEGATKGYLVLSEKGQAKFVADAVVLRDADGECFFEQTSELRPTQNTEDE